MTRHKVVRRSLKIRRTTASRRRMLPRTRSFRSMFALLEGAGAAPVRSPTTPTRLSGAGEAGSWFSM